MKKWLVLFAMVSLLLTSSVFAQTLADYVLETRGDTLVVKDYFDMNQQPNSLYQVIFLDSIDVPAGRVYELKANGVYPDINTVQPHRATVIVGAITGTLALNADAASAPPLICGAVTADGSYTPGIAASFDLTVKNCNCTPSNSNFGLNWSYFGASAGVTVTLENCLLERTRWVFTNTNGDNISWYISDCYAVNLLGQPCRRNGGILDCFAAQNNLYVENTSHVNVQGLIYKYRNNLFNRISMNHNNFINCSNLVFLDLGYQKQVNYTNNIFVNCQVQPYCGNTIDAGEEDIEQMPIGIVNLYNDPDAPIDATDRHFLVENNVLAYDARLADVEDIANNTAINGSSIWTSQMITMNTRTQAMFDDDATYPYLYEGNWMTEMPNFTDSGTLLGVYVDSLKEYSLLGVDTTTSVNMAAYRVTDLGYEYADWPIPFDFSYDNASLLTAATGGFPVGDLNWFPSEKATWLAQRDAEYTAIDAALAAGTGTTAVAKNVGLADDFELQQNYPNPFNPLTSISYTVPKASDVTLKVYDAMGRQVATLVNGYKTASTYSVQFDASNLASGTYFYTLEAKDFKATHKMLLMK